MSSREENGRHLCNFLKQLLVGRGRRKSQCEFNNRIMVSQVGVPQRCYVLLLQISSSLEIGLVANGRNKVF